VVITTYFVASNAGAQDSLGASAKSGGDIDTIQSIEQRLKTIDEKLESVKIDEPWWQHGALITGVITGLIGLCSGFGVALYTQRAQRIAAKEDRLESHLFESLKWFERGTQKRGIGLSIIEGNWEDVQVLHPTWTAVLVAQAVYLVAEKPKKKELTAHELENRRRVCSLLKRATLTQGQHDTLSKVIKDAKRLTDDEKAEWNTLVS
jgi:hypothetical protein